MKNELKLLFLIGVMALQSCYLDTNTTDPQCSLSIEDSKNNNMFVAEYKMGNTDNQMFRVKTAWVEKCWKYKQSLFFSPPKQKTGSYQLNLTLDKPDPEFLNNYGQKWDLKDESYGYFRSFEDSIYSLSYDFTSLPDTFDIIVENYNKDFSKIPFAHFTVLKK